MRKREYSRESGTDSRTAESRQTKAKSGNRAAGAVWGWINTIAHGVLSLLFRIVGKELKDSQFLAFMQFVKFGIVGLTNTVLSYVVYVVALLLMRKLSWFPKADYLIAQILAFIISVAWSFYWNNRFVFTLHEGEQRSVWKALLKTYISYSFTGLFLNSILLVVWVQLLHVSEFLGPILNLLISVPVNFLINKYWAFRSK